MLLSAASVPAQTIPSPALPGRIEQQFAPPPTAPQVQPPAPLPVPPTGPLPVKPGAVSFTLKEVIVDGVTVYTPEQLRPAYAAFLERTISVDDLSQIEQAITTKYRSDGYILARAVIPTGQALDPTAAILHVRVYEGYIDKVLLTPEYQAGERGRLVKTILDKIAGGCRSGDRPADGKPCALHRDTLERYLLLANDLPGVTASAVIEPSPDTSGAADLFVTITQKSYDASARVDNRSSPYIGPTTGQLAGSLNNLTDRYERSTIRVVGAAPLSELWLINVNEEIPLNSEGLRLAVGGTHSRSHPGDALRSSNLVSYGDSASLALAYPWLRTRAENLMFRGDFTVRNALTYESDAETFDDHTRVLTAGATYDLADRWLGVNFVDAAVGQGVDILGATKRNAPRTSHTGADPNFTKFTGELSRLQQIADQWNLLIAATGQYATSKLLASEQFAFGGERYGRGFDPSEILGDRGIAGKVELQYTPSRLPAILGIGDILRTVQFYGFYDIGRVWSLDVGAADPIAASAGAGVRFLVTDYVSGYVELAAPLRRAVQSQIADGKNGKAPRFYFSIASRF
jgi:hemolysin activation/secretion protein